MKQKATAEQKEKWHEDPKNWFLGFLYFNRQDHRILVAKKNPYMGWTINFASIYSYLILATIVTVFILIRKFQH